VSHQRRVATDISHLRHHAHVANQVMVSVAGQTAFFRLRGRATAGESTSFKAAAEGLRAQGLSDVVIDLTECQSMDSTFIGVLAGLSRRLRREGGAAGKVELVNTSRRSDANWTIFSCWISSA